MFEQDNAATLAALRALPDKNVAAGVEKLLINGTEFKETWTITQTGNGEVYFTVLKFQQIGFLEDFQFAQTTLSLNGQTDPKYQAAYEALTEQFSNVFYPTCLKNKLDPSPS